LGNALGAVFLCARLALPLFLRGELGRRERFRLWLLLLLLLHRLPVYLGIQDSDPFHHLLRVDELFRSFYDRFFVGMLFVHVQAR
jgi:hypothetical protein